MNLDKNKIFYNQFTDGDPTECCGITVADVVGNLLGIYCDPDYSYAAGFNVAGQTPTDQGEQPQWAVDGAIAFGVLPTSAETFTALSRGELFVADYAHYSPQQDATALKYAMNGRQCLYNFQDIWTWLEKGESGVVIPMLWYQSFNAPDPQGFLPQPGGQTTNHCVAAYDTGETNGLRYLVIKPWEGPHYGTGGYVNVTEGTFNKVFAGTAYAFDPTASRFISMLGILVRRFPGLVSYVPGIIANNLKKKL